MKLLKWLCEFALIAALMFGFAYLFLLGWDKTEYVDQAQAGKRYGYQNNAPAPPTGLSANFGEPSEPRVHTFKDASQGERGKE